MSNGIVKMLSEEDWLMMGDTHMAIFVIQGHSPKGKNTSKENLLINSSR